MQWPFGYGLTYSTQMYTLTKHAAGSGSVTVSVSNAGRAGDAVVLVFMRPRMDPYGRGSPIPRREPASKLKLWLVHFERIHAIAAGGTAEVSVDITPELATLTDSNGDAKLWSGCYEVFVEGDAGSSGAGSVEMACDEGGCGQPCK